MSHHHGAGLGAREDLEARIEQYRELILRSLDGLTEEQARAEIVPGRPSLLGVVRHTAFVEGVWFAEAVDGTTRPALGLPVSTANSWKTRKVDSIASVTALCRRISDIARTNLAGRDLDEIVHGRGERTVRSLYTHVLSELAWNTGQLDILRALVVAAPEHDAGR